MDIGYDADSRYILESSVFCSKITRLKSVRLHNVQ